MKVQGNKGFDKNGICSKKYGTHLILIN